MEAINCEIIYIAVNRKRWWNGGAVRKGEATTFVPGWKLGESDVAEGKASVMGAGKDSFLNIVIINDKRILSVFFVARRKSWFTGEHSRATDRSACCQVFGACFCVSFIRINFLVRETLSTLRQVIGGGKFSYFLLR